ncbi:MAG: Hsp20/alpha crystallin family protein [Bacteroidales bacterium]|nr:Hsp20/alpha crystallin family protein [Bacteroidales bacterium]MCF8391664.1 Hsp20/alpha crystallin family protein [Bacteroidales bacterium]
MKLVKFYPNNGMLRRSNDSLYNFSNLWDSYLNDDFGFLNPQSPKVNIREEEDRFLLEMAVPGISKKDININVEKDVLRISHEEKQKTEDKDFSRIEFNYSGFDRSFKLGDSVDLSKIEAKMENGILQISLLKKKEALENSKREIAIS